MKISVDVDCTPEEARRFMGLPDMTSVHEAYLSRIRGAIEQGVTPEMIQSMMRTWSPMGEAGMAVWRQMVERMSGSCTAE
jgi:hypothetical protein